MKHYKFMPKKKWRLPYIKTVICTLQPIILFLCVTPIFADGYTYESSPSMKSFTSTGTGTTDGPVFNYNSEYISDGTDKYTNGQLKATLYSYTHSGNDLVLTFQLKKNDDGYFKNGNSGKIFIVEADGSTYAQSFSISNSTTSKINFPIHYVDFTGSRYFYVYLITSDKVYKQYGGKITVTCTEVNSPPTIYTQQPNYVNNNSALLLGLVKPNGKKTYYSFYFGSSRNNLREVDSGTIAANAGPSEHSVSYKVTGLNAGTQYYYKVTGYNSVGSAEGDVVGFTTETNPNTPPSKPSNPYPASGSTNVDLNTKFTWICSDADGDNLKYNIYIGTSSSNLNFYQYSTNTMCQFTNLEPGTKYYWRIDPYDNEDTTTGPVWNFTTVGSSIVGDCTFSDLPSTSDFYSSTCYLYKKGVLSGSDENGKMSTENPLKRAHLAKIAFRGVYSIREECAFKRDF